MLADPARLEVLSASATHPGELPDEQARRATELLQRNLTRSTDWIVLNVTIDVLVKWAAHDPWRAAWLILELERLRLEARKSVAQRASKRLSEAPGEPEKRSGATALA